MNKKKSVLIVDDDKFLLEMYRKKFEQNDMSVDVALGSEETLVKLRAGANPDILILDIIMPGADGVELLETIRKENLIAKDNIVIMLTNENNQDIIEKSQKLGVDGYIIKAMSVPTETIKEILKIADLKNK